MTATLAMIPGLGSVGATELIIVLSIILLLFGAKRIPELAKGLGSGIREFKRGTSGEADKEEVRDSDKDNSGELTDGDAVAKDREETAAADRPTERAGERAEQKR